MASITSIFAPQIVEQHGRDHSGVFTWEIDADLFYADAAVAQLFELDAHEAEEGLPLLSYLNRIHSDDRQRAAKSIHDTILSGGPCQQDYRILQRIGPPIDVMAFGRCFKGKNGRATHYAGIVHPAPVEQTSATTLRSHCVAAYSEAISEGHVAVAQHLAQALQELDRERPIGFAKR